jgi:DNA-binding MarR family transcriptional regulator
MILQAIENLGDVSVKRISDDVSLSQATVTTVLNRLQDRGLIERVRGQVDKRVVNARLTPKGCETLQTSPPLLHEKFISRFEFLAGWEQTQILSSLQRVAAMMDAQALDVAPMLDIAPADSSEISAPK